MTNYEANYTRTDIDQAAEAIFEILYHHGGDMDLKDLGGKAGGPGHIFDMAVGSLVEKGDIDLFPKGDSFIVHRTAPALAVFPLRGN